MTRWFFGVLIAYASIGLVASLIVHIASFFVAPPGGNTLFMALHVGIFPLWIAVISLAGKMAGGGFGFGQRLSWVHWKGILADSPAWMRVMTYGFFGYALVNFAFFFLFTASGHGAAKNSGAPPELVWHGFSGHWMLFYSAGLAIATVAYVRGPERLVPKCPNGHAVSPTDRFCPACGRAIPGGAANRS